MIKKRAFLDHNMIIGVTGKYASGRDSTAKILENMGFERISLSNPLKEELKSRKQLITQQNLLELGNEFRSNHGTDFLARKALGRISDGENYVFTSFYEPAELNLLMLRKDFLLVLVSSTPALRLKRLVERNRHNDSATAKMIEEKELLHNADNKHKERLEAIAKLAKIELNNDSTLEKLREKVEKLVNDWMFKLQLPRPSWDEYFMNIAQAIKMRCNCMSSKKGSVIIRDKIILSTGYNGTPKGITHCNEGGCPRCTSRHLGKIKSGQYTEPCTCAHSEENAIVQAAYNGASTKDAVLYTTFTPCTSCAKMIINAGIKEVVAKITYPDEVGTRMLREAGVMLRVLK